MDAENKKTDLPDDDWVVYIPDKVFWAFESALFKMEMAQKEFHKLADEMKQVK